MLLRELFEFLPKSKRSASYGNDYGKFPFFTSSNIVDKFVDTPDYDGEYLVIGDGGSGNCKYISGKFSVSDHNYVLKPKPGTNAKAVCHFLKKDDFHILNEGFKGVGIKNVSKTYIQEIDYPSNPRFCDEEIVNNLDTIEQLMEKERLSINLFDESIKSRFMEMFSDKIESPLSECSFEDVCEGTIGLTYKPDNVSSDGTIVLRSGNIKDGRLQLKDDIVRVSGIQIPSDKILKDRDILMCSRNGSPKLVGKTCLIRNPKEIMTFGAFMTVIRTKFPYVLNCFMNTTFFRRQLTTTQTSSVNQITNGMLMKYKMFRPTDTEEFEFASFVSQIDKLKFVCRS